MTVATRVPRPEQQEETAAITDKEIMKNRKKSVSFLLEEQVVCKVTLFSSMTIEERCRLWYQASDIKRFRKYDRNLCMQLQVLLDHNVPSYIIEMIDQQECLRGLESRLSQFRQKERAQTVRTITESQHKSDIDAQHLALVSRRCTAVAKQTALFTGIKDYYTVYYPARIENSLQVPTDDFLPTCEIQLDSPILSQ